MCAAMRATARPLRGVVPAAQQSPGPIGIGHHRLAADFMEGDVLRRVPGRRRNRQGGEDAFLVTRSPFQDLHAAHRAAHHGEQLVYAQMIDQAGLRFDHVADGNHRKLEPVRRAGGGVDGGRSRRSHAAAQDVGADHEEAAAYRQASRDRSATPTSRACRLSMDARDMLVAGQRMANEDGVRFVGIELPVGLIRNGERPREFFLTGKAQRGRLPQSARPGCAAHSSSLKFGVAGIVVSGGGAAMP